MRRSRPKVPIMQHELFINPNARSRRAFPLVVVLHADIAVGKTRLVAPLAPHTGPLAGGTSRALPLINHDGRRYAAAFPLISALPRNQLRDALGSLAPYRDDLTRALDWLCFGI
jgi:toxin CcdB